MWKFHVQQLGQHIGRVFQRWAEHQASAESGRRENADKFWKYCMWIQVDYYWKSINENLQKYDTGKNILLEKILFFLVPDWAAWKEKKIMI